jgi:hypothetical protein
VHVVSEVAQIALDRGISHLTFFAFSTENWDNSATPIARIAVDGGEGRDTDWQFRNRTGIAQSNLQRSSETECLESQINRGIAAALGQVREALTGSGLVVESGIGAMRRENGETDHIRMKCGNQGIVGSLVELNQGFEKLRDVINLFGTAENEIRNVCAGIRTDMTVIAFGFGRNPAKKRGLGRREGL